MIFLFSSPFLKKQQRITITKKFQEKKNYHFSLCSLGMKKKLKSTYWLYATRLWGKYMQIIKSFHETYFSNFIQFVPHILQQLLKVAIPFIELQSLVVK